MEKPLTRFSKAYHSEFTRAVHFIPLSTDFLSRGERGDVWQKSVESCDFAIVRDLAETVTINVWGGDETRPVRVSLALFLIP